MVRNWYDSLNKMAKKSLKGSVSIASVDGRFRLRWSHFNDLGRQKRFFLPAGIVNDTNRAVASFFALKTLLICTDCDSMPTITGSFHAGVQTPISSSLAKSPAFTPFGAPSPVGKPPLPPSPRPANAPATPPSKTPSLRSDSANSESDSEAPKETLVISVPIELRGGFAEPDLSPEEDRVKALTAVKAVVGDLKTCGDGKVELEKSDPGGAVGPPRRARRLLVARPDADQDPAELCVVSEATNVFDL